MDVTWSRMEMKKGITSTAAWHEKVFSFVVTGRKTSRMSMRQQWLVEFCKDFAYSKLVLVLVYHLVEHLKVAKDSKNKGWSDSILRCIWRCSYRADLFQHHSWRRSPCTRRFKVIGRDANCKTTFQTNSHAIWVKVTALCKYRNCTTRVASISERP